MVEGARKIPSGCVCHPALWRPFKWNCYKTNKKINICKSYSSPVQSLQSPRTVQFFVSLQSLQPLQWREVVSVTPPCRSRLPATPDGYSVILKIRYWFSANIFSLFVAFKVRFQRLVLGRFNWMLEAEEGGGEGVGMTCLHDQTRPNSLSISFISEILRRKKHTHKQHRH